jgi:uncharacterized repeat protein (TIGR01451 family)
VPGQSLTYDIVVSNLGPATADAVMLSDPLPPGTTFLSCTSSAGTCSGPAVGTNGTVTAALGPIAPGATATVTIGATVTGPVGTLVNVATATSSTPDPDPGSNQGTAVTTVGAGIPVLSRPLLALLGLLIATAAVWVLRRL